MLFRAEIDAVWPVSSEGHHSSDSCRDGKDGDTGDGEGALLFTEAGQKPVRSFSMKSMAPPMLAHEYPLENEPSAAVSATSRREQVRAMPLLPSPFPVLPPVREAPVSAAVLVLADSRTARRPGAVQDADRGEDCWRGGVDISFLMESSRRRDDA